MGNNGILLVGTVATVVIAAVATFQWWKSRPSLRVRIWSHPFSLPEHLFEALDEFRRRIRVEELALDHNNYREQEAHSVLQELQSSLAEYPLAYLQRPRKYHHVELTNAGHQKVDSIEVRVPQLTFFATERHDVKRADGSIIVPSVKPGESVHIEAWAGSLALESVEALMENGRPSIQNHAMVPAWIPGSLELFKILAISLTWVLILVFAIATLTP